jgi:hypothetical protein
VFGEVSQRLGRTILHGFFSTSFSCDSVVRWSATVVSDDGLFTAGKASVSADAFAFSGGDSADVSASAQVILKGSGPTKARCPAKGNDGFEAGAIDSNVIPCWTVVDQAGSYGSWCNQGGTALPQGICFGSAVAVDSPPQGLQAAMTNQTGPGSHVLYRCGTLKSGNIDFQLYINNEAGAYISPASLDYTSGPNQQLRADLVTAAGMTADLFTVDPADILLNLYQTQPFDPQVSPYQAVSGNASGYIGQDVCMRFAAVDNIFFFHAVSIELKTTGH